MQALSMQALAVALQHPAVAADQQNICRLLQVCRAWRALVQSSAASLTEVRISLFSRRPLIKFSGFAEWLARHRGIIGKLDIIGLSASNRQGNQSNEAQIARQLLDFSMQSATSAAPLRLRSFKSSLPATAGLLAVLPAATLTYLGVSTDSSNCFSCLSSLSNLRHMSLDMSGMRVKATDSCFREVGKLQQLTGLQLDEVATAAETGLLPAQLQHLQLNYTAASQAGVGACIKLQHLTGLQELQLTANLLAAGSTLPPNLQSLYISAEWPADGLVGLSGLQQLTQVILDSFCMRSHHLRALEQLPHLEDLTLDLTEDAADTLVEVAAAWRNLPLQNLRIHPMSISSANVQRLMQHMSTATKLTELSINLYFSAAGPEDPELEVFQDLRGLSNLQKLHLSMGHASHFASKDAQHLSVLTTLTYLEVGYNGSGPCVDATTLSLLALKLPCLKVLAVNVDSSPDDHRVGTAALPVIGQLTTLQSLHLEDFSSEDARRGLELLTGLSRLTSLIGFDAAGQALDAFWDTVRAQQQGLSPS